MPPRIRLVFAFLFFATVAIHNYEAASPTDPDRDPQTAKLLQDAEALIDKKNLSAAIEKCNQVIARFRTRYGSRKEKLYCGRTPAENLGYLLKAVAEKHTATVLSSTWSDAYFLKAYALQDAGRIAEAKSAIKAALALSPYNSRYLCELGEMYQLEKNWSKAKEQFQAAEDNANLCPDEVKVMQLAQARRGSAYVLVELGKLAEAEKKYQCLAANPHDTRAARELEYVRGLRAKTKSN